MTHTGHAKLPSIEANRLIGWFRLSLIASIVLTFGFAARAAGLESGVNDKSYKNIEDTKQIQISRTQRHAYHECWRKLRDEYDNARFELMRRVQEARLTEGRAVSRQAAAEYNSVRDAYRRAEASLAKEKTRAQNANDLSEIKRIAQQSTQIAEKAAAQLNAILQHEKEQLARIEKESKAWKGREEKKLKREFQTAVAELRRHTDSISKLHPSTNESGPTRNPNNDKRDSAKRSCPGTKSALIDIRIPIGTPPELHQTERHLKSVNSKRLLVSLIESIDDTNTRNSLKRHLPKSIRLEYPLHKDALRAARSAEKTRNGIVTELATTLILKGTKQPKGVIRKVMQRFDPVSRKASELLAEKLADEYVLQPIIERSLRGNRFREETLRAELSKLVTQSIEEAKNQ